MSNQIPPGRIFSWDLSKYHRQHVQRVQIKTEMNNNIEKNLKVAFVRDTLSNNSKIKQLANNHHLLAYSCL